MVMVTTERCAAHEMTSAHLALAAHGGTLRPMFDVAHHGGSVDRPAGGFPSRTILYGVVFGCALLWWSAARAGALYQCSGPSDEPVFSSSKDGYNDCKAISSSASPPRPSRPSLPAQRVALTGFAGYAVSTAHTHHADVHGRASFGDSDVLSVLLVGV